MNADRFLPPAGLRPRYHYLRELGQGGMGRVLLVRDTSLGKELALKVLLDPPDRPGAIEEFQREFALLSRLEHPSIARSYDFGYLDGLPYFTSEFIPGEPLATGGRGESREAVLGHLLEVVDAVAFLHRSEVLHLDIKPANVIVGSAPGRARAVLIDFGLFRRGFTVFPGRKVKGSLPYMAPEYFRGEGLGAWTDVYALGVTIYRALTRRFPRAWRKTGPGEAAEIEWDPVPAPPSQHWPSLPAGLDNILLRCLALDPASRFRDAGELLEALRRVEGGTSFQCRAATPLLTVGREADLARARRFLQDLMKAGKGKPAVVSTLLVTGPAGLGQSHFLRELKVEAQTQGFRFILETGYPGWSGPPGSLLRSIGIHLEEDGSGRSRWEAFLSRLGRPRKATRPDASESEERLGRAGEVARMAGAIRDPLVLAVDGLQYWDEISVELLIHLVRFLGEGRARRPPAGVVVGYREEGTPLRLLRELTGYLLTPGKAELITLRPLEVAETLALYRQWGGREGEGARNLAVFQETGGSPTRLLTLTAAGRDGAQDTRAGPPPAAAPAGRPARAEEPRPPIAGDSGPGAADPEAIGPDHRAGVNQLAGTGERDLLLALSVLRRPSPESELAALTGLPLSRVRACLKSMERRGLTVTRDAGAGRRGWSPGPASRPLIAGTAPSRLRAMHQRVARSLARRNSGKEDPGAVEAAHHFRLSGNRAAFIDHGLRAARYLKSTLQNRAALDLFRSVLEALPRRRLERRLAVAFEVAEIQARVGELDQAIGILKEISHGARGLPEAARLRVLLRLAVLYSRRGDFGRAEAMFREGLAKAREQRTRLSRQELLTFLNEHAAMKVFVGEYEESLRLCDEGLRLLGRARRPSARQVALRLYATRANVRLRTFDHAAAIRDLETSLQIAEAIGSPANQAVALNNLAIVYSNCDRYREAIHAFRDAEKMGLTLDEGPTLLAINGNLAVLEAKTGDFAAMEKSLAEVERLCSGSGGDRQELCLHHSRGLGLLYRGAYAAAQPSFEASIRLSEAGGDRLLSAMDGVHRAEALVFQGAYGEADRELVRLSEPGQPARIRRMALSRRSLLAALSGDAAGVERTGRQHAEIHEDRPTPFLESWDDLLIGWSLSISGAGRRDAPQGAPGGLLESAGLRLERAESYFRRHGLRPAAALARWARAEASFLSGDFPRARQLLEPDPPAENDLLRVLRPLLQARLILAGAPGEESRARCADLLSRAGAALVGNALPEWAARLAAVRAALGAEDRKVEADLLRRRQELALELPEEKRRAYLGAGHFRVWTADLDGWRPSRRASPPGRSPSGETTSATGERTRSLTGTAAGGPRAGLVAKSPAMRRLTAILDRLRGSDLPVLIRGETGSGKELVARAIHGESRRAGGPFLIVDCAALPAGLLEAELFGARAGAFTDLKDDRPGILSVAAGGIVLIDEVAGVPLEAQAKLLRVLSERSFRRLGDTGEERLDVRFLFSTARSLEDEVKQGRFRADLYHRIQVLSVDVPPLRERPEDLRALVDLFLREGEGRPPALGRGVIERLRELAWPGNVRELRNLIQRLRLEHPRQIPLEAIPAARGEHDTRSIFPRNLLAGGVLSDLRCRLERDYLLYHLRRLGGDSAALGRFLDLTRPQLYRLCRQCGIRLRSEKGKRN